MIKIVNVRKDDFDIYIGRFNSRYALPQSPFANPFVIGKDGSREDVIAKYEFYIRNSPKLIELLPMLKEKILGCWCKPDACHGDVLIRLIDEFRL